MQRSSSNRRLLMTNAESFTSPNASVPPYQRPTCYSTRPTGRSELGETVAEAAHTAKTADRKLAEEKLFNILLSRPNIEHSDLVDALDGKQMRKLRLIHDHVASGLIVSSGRGVKGSPRTYRMAAVPTDTRGMVEVPTEGTNASL